MTTNPNLNHTKGFTDSGFNLDKPQAPSKGTQANHAITDNSNHTKPVIQRVNENGLSVDEQGTVDARVDKMNPGPKGVDKKATDRAKLTKEIIAKRPK